MIKKNGKKLVFLLVSLCIIFTTTVAYSHSGRTDANGGHKDNQNKSGLESSLQISITQQPTAVQINETIENMEVGNKNNLTATISPADTADKNVTWESSDSEIVTIDNEGKIIAKKAGSVTITAISANDLKDSIEIIVKEPVKIDNNNSSADADPVSGLLGLGALGGGGYWIYKKNKK